MHRFINILEFAFLLVTQADVLFSECRTFPTEKHDQYHTKFESSALISS